MESNEKQLIAALQSSGPAAAYRFCSDMSAREIVVARNEFRALSQVCKTALLIKALKNQSIVERKVQVQPDADH